MTSWRSLRRVCLVGVRGVGKTTLIRSVVADMPHFDYVVGSAILRELAGPEFASFDLLPLARKEHFRRDAILWMERRQEKRRLHLLCDGHTTLPDPVGGRVEQVFTEQDCRFFNELVLLEEPPDVVVERRRMDTRKVRSLDPQIIQEEIDAERRTCERIASVYGLRLHRRPPGGPQEASRWLREVLAP